MIADNHDAVFKEIGAVGHWRILIRPRDFNPLRLKNLSVCIDAVESSQVRLRGWPFPYSTSSYRLLGSNYVQSGYVGRGEDLKEAWRLFQSGQFLDYHVLQEDHHELPWVSSHYRDFENGRPDKYLEYVSTIYHITEIFEFASRLAEKGLLFPGADIEITISDLRGRYLVPWTPDYFLEDDLICDLDEVTFKRTCSTDDLLSSSSQGAVEAAAYVFERFGWLNPDHAVLGRVQAKLLTRG